MELATVQQAIADYGYWALFVGTFLEGETFFLLGGIAARQGLLDPWWVALAALGGGFVGDQVFFLLGMWRGTEMLAAFPPLARRAVRARHLVRRHAVTLMLLSRFLYGFRMVVPLACGASRVPWHTFLGLNLVSAVCWTVTFGGLGYLFGGWVSRHMDLMTNLPKIAMIVVGGIAVTLVVGHLVRRRLLNE